MHRPSNVDDPHMLKRILQTIREISQKLPVVFPLHPRTKTRIEALGEPGRDFLTCSTIHVLDPTGYLESIALQKNAKAVITDSGGLQEETTALGVPCLTIRENTERPVTVTEGTNTLVGTDMSRLLAEVDRILKGQGKAGRVPENWDGRAAERIASIMTRAAQVNAA